MLTELQELQDNKNIFVFAATNDIDSLDPAIKDRFAGSICEIKILDLEERAQLFQKVFADRGVLIDTELAQRLAEVTRPSSYDEKTKDYLNRFSNRDIEYIVATTLLKRFADYKKDSKNKNHICTYIRKAMDATEKKGWFAWFKSTYCDGI